ncbi:hypothetical protein GE09DRAFT_507441 [Coniochaeta sp. 2T2.1]|nr:hypothetical protein GE09DRAFT_507441 [Coniochaeta sp. 2T2.1]
MEDMGLEGVPAATVTAVKPRRPPVKRACDQCKLKKIKCSLTGPPCDTCRDRGFRCTYLNQQKKRGPPAKHLAHLQQQPIQPVLQDPKSMTRAQGQSSPQLASAIDVGSSSLPTPSSEWPSASLPRQHGFMTSNLGDIVGFDHQIDTEYWPPDRTSLPWDNLFVDFALPLVIEGEPDTLPRVPFYDTLSAGLETANWPPYINEASIIPWIDVYFDRLHPTLPVLSRPSLFTRILRLEHRQNPFFGSMLLSLCAFAITQPIFISERPTSSSRERQAKQLMDEALRMRGSSNFGENPTLEAVLTSFFLFGCLFGSNQHNAAWLRLREAIDLAQTLGLDDPKTYNTEDKGERLRTYLVLAITERAYAIQRRHPITLNRISLSDDLTQTCHGLLSGIIVYNEKDAAAIMTLSTMMRLFEVVDGVECWNGTCRECSTSRDTVRAVHDSLARFEGTTQKHWLDDSAQRPEWGADVIVTQKWLQNRLWCLCLRHNLLDSSRPELCVGWAVSLAEATLESCRSLSLSSMEAHGIGLIEKLYDIATTAVSVQRDAGLGDTFLKVFTTLRGGNHPYLERFIAHLGSGQ